MEQNDMIVRTRFGMADNPVFAVFYPAEAVAGISGFTGSAARKYHLAEMPFSPEKARTGPSRLFGAGHFRQPFPFEET